MADVQDDLKTCSECGATIYPEHLTRHSADFWGGKLLCPHCLAEKRAPAAESARPAGETDELVTLTDDEPQAGGPRGVAPPRPRIQTSAPVVTERVFKRSLLEGGAATRCKTFHCKLTDASIVHLNDQINEWVDAHPDVAIKFANTAVGSVEGKHTEPHLVITIFY